MSRRLDIYLNGRDGLREIAVNMLLSWRNVPVYSRTAWRTFNNLLRDLLPLALMLIGPLLVVVAPVLAIFTAHRIESEEEARARLRRDIHRNGRGQ